MQDRTIGLGDDTPPAGATRRAGRRAPIRHGGRSVETPGRARAERGGLAVERANASGDRGADGRTGETGTPATEEALTGPTGERAAASPRAGAAPTGPRPTRRTDVVRPGTVRVWRSNRTRRPCRSARRRRVVPRTIACPRGCRSLERALVNPAAGCSSRRPRSSIIPGCCPAASAKSCGWAWDEYLKEVAAAEGMADGEPSRLDAVTVALLALGETRRPHPAAPAAAIPGLRGRPQAA